MVLSFLLFFLALAFVYPSFRSIMNLINDGKISAYLVQLKITFVLED